MTSEKQIGIYSLSSVKEEYDLLRIANSIEELGGNVFQIEKQYSSATFYFKIDRNQKMHKFLDDLETHILRW